MAKDDRTPEAAIMRMPDRGAISSSPNLGIEMIVRMAIPKKRV
jgi:hypothetical protein